MKLTLEPTRKDSVYPKITIEVPWDHGSVEEWVEQLLKPALAEMHWDPKQFFPDEE